MEAINQSRFTELKPGDENIEEGHHTTWLLSTHLKISKIKMFLKGKRKNNEVLLYNLQNN